MKKSYILIAMAMVAALSMAGCKNNKKSQNQEPTQEEIQAQKQALADSVLAQIDTLANKFYDATSRSFSFKNFELTDAEKMVKPDYLLDPSIASTLVTKSQKTNALAMYSVDRLVLALYDMPVDETNEAMARLAAEINHPIDAEFMRSNAPVSEKVRKTFEVCKERGELLYFWKFEFAILREIGYLMSMNPDLFFSKISEDEWRGFIERWISLTSALNKLAQYDTEISEIWESILDKSPKEGRFKYKTLEAGKQSYISDKSIRIARRNALLQ